MGLQGLGVWDCRVWGLGSASWSHRGGGGGALHSLKELKSSYNHSIIVTQHKFSDGNPMQLRV